MKVANNDTFVWEIVELNQTLFREIFEFEPVFKQGDQTKYTLINVLDAGEHWSIQYERWDYEQDWSQKGEEGYIIVFKDPARYEGQIFLPVPTDEFLIDIQANLTDYSVDSLRLIKRVDDYVMIREYGENGALFSETYTDPQDNVIVKAEQVLSLIPIGNYFIGIMIISVFSIIIVLIKKKRVLLIY